jgi:TPP-dependent indolepyruvate ferredoxin oxidoreductase alpha subunit
MFHIAFLEGENFGKAKIKVVFDIFKCFKNKIQKIGRIKNAFHGDEKRFLGNEWNCISCPPCLVSIDCKAIYPKFGSCS